MDHLYIKVDSQDLTTKAMDDLVEVTVETNLHLPHMFTIHLHDEQIKWMDEGPFELGKEVEIAFVREENGTSRRLIKGEITAIEPDFREGTQAMLLIRGYDRSHRLHRGTHSKAYLQVTDSDLASRIAKEAGLRAQVDSTTEVYNHVLQHNQTHMEFLSARAQRIGYEFYVEDKTLVFRKPNKNGDALELEWGHKLKSFRPRLTLAEQVDEVIVKGWDDKTRQVIVGQAARGEAEPQVGIDKSGAQLASSAFNSARRIVVNRPVCSQAEASLQAQAILDELSGAFIEAEGMCYGEPELKAGRMVKLTSLGKRFSGTYLVTAATHVYRADGGYMTAFGIHGRRPDTLYTLVQPGQGKSSSAWPGTVVGIVTNNKDSEDRGRVKVKFPWLSDDVESDWARLVGVGAGPSRGLYCLPEVNDEVLVAFEHGDPDRPFVIGGLWNGQDKPPLPANKVLENGKVNQRIFKTRAGHKLTFFDGSENKVVLETAGGQVLTLDDAKNEVTLQSKAAMTLKSATNLTIEATGKLSLKGQSFSLNADAMGEVKAGATLNVQGALVKIN